MLPINLDKLLADNPGIDAEKLKEWLRATKALSPLRMKYRFNLVPPFSGRHHRSPVAEMGGPNDNVRKPL